MTRRRFFAPSAQFAPDHLRVTLAGDEARHLRDVLRLGRGDEVFVFDGDGREFRCTVDEAERERAALIVNEEVKPARPESTLRFAPGVVLLKGDKLCTGVQRA